MTLRPYQLDAVNSIVNQLLISLSPIVANLATGAGKSIIIAELAKIIHTKSGGKSILCLAPSAELVIQNREKFLATGEPASIFSASLNSKDLRHPIVFGTPKSVKNSINSFGDRFAMVVIDEAHGLTDSIKSIVTELRKKYSKLRVVGVTATPYRTGSGYIYGIDEKGKSIPPERSKNPYFERCVYKIGANDLIAMGYLTPPLIGQIGEKKYDTSNLHLNKMGKFDNVEVDKAFLGHGRKTSAIVSDIVLKAKDRKGVILFASTVEHAQEVLASLPPGLSAIVTGETPKGERKKILQEFKSKKLKYIVNVAVLTTGFDAPHIDVVAFLRATESVGLFQQMIGRGLRLSKDKKDCLILDYAENVDRHCPDGDLFNPKLKALASKNNKADFLEQKCPRCGQINLFSLRKDEGGYKINVDGYFTDLLGKVITTQNGDPLPAHYGRRCNGIIPSFTNFEGIRCGYRWSMKVCEACGAENDIVAKKCTHCKGELIDPNEKLIMEFIQFKKDPTKIQIDEVIDCSAEPTVSRAGNECLRVTFITPYRTFTIWLQKESKNERAVRDFAMFRNYESTMKTVEYQKEKNGFYRVLSYNKPIQMEQK